MVAKFDGLFQRIVEFYKSSLPAYGEHFDDDDSGGGLHLQAKSSPNDNV